MYDVLKVYWSEIQANEGIHAHWAELGHAMLRLKFAVSEFENGMKHLIDLHSIYRVHYQLENYYVRVYELRERLYSFAAELLKTDKKKAKNMLLKPGKKEKLLFAWPSYARGGIDPLKQVLQALEEDIAVRNIHTHDTFVRLALNEGPCWTDIEDLWWDLEEDATSLAVVLKLVGEQGLRLVEKYKARIEYTDRRLNEFLKEALMPHL